MNNLMSIVHNLSTVLTFHSENNIIVGERENVENIVHLDKTLFLRRVLSDARKLCEQ